MPDGDGRDEPTGWGAPGQPPPESWTWDQPATTGQPTSGFAPPTAAVPVPHQAAGAPRKPRGRGWLVVLLVALGVILAFAISGTVLFVTRTLPPYYAAQHFLDDVTHDNRSSAAGHLCAADAGSPEAAIQQVATAVRSVTGSFKTLSANALGVDRNGSTATVKFSTTGASNNKTFDLTVVEENGSWKACP